MGPVEAEERGVVEADVGVVVDCRGRPGGGGRAVEDGPLEQPLRPAAQRDRAPGGAPARGVAARRGLQLLVGDRGPKRAPHTGADRRLAIDRRDLAGPDVGPGLRRRDDRVAGEGRALLVERHRDARASATEAEHRAVAGERVELDLGAAGEATRAREPESVAMAAGRAGDRRLAEGRVLGRPAADPRPRVVDCAAAAAGGSPTGTRPARASARTVHGAPRFRFTPRARST